MPVRVFCPSCDKELNAPDDLLGKTVACPRCNEHFPVEDGNGAKAPKQNLYPPGFDAPPRSGSETESPPDLPPQPPAQTAPSGAARFRGLPGADSGVGGNSSAPPPPPRSSAPPAAIPPAAPPPSASVPSATPPDAPPAMPFKSKPPKPSSPWKSTASSRSDPTGPPAPPPAPDAKPGRASQPQSGQRSVQQARFITAGETATHMRLGADGQLPQLALREGEQREKKTEQKQGMSPLILIGLLVSVAASVGILFIPEESQTESRSKAAARKAIESHYIEISGTIDPAASNKPYQFYLREALQAHSRSDYGAEFNHYRHVMNLLHSEGISETFGLTGQIGTTLNPNDPPPIPSDRHLEKQLSILLGD